MQNSYTYWRASHPLVFISLHLLIGILIAENIAFGQAIISPKLIAFSFAISLLVIYLQLYYVKQSITSGIINSCCLLFWGMAIQQIAINQVFNFLPYPVQFITYCRNLVIHKIHQTIQNKEASEFALALLLGIKSEVNQPLLNAYAQLGIIHIIAISGMHLDILFKSLTQLTRLLPRKKYFLVLELIFVLSTAWIYTLMAFSSPSIVRATLFFSIYFIGKFLSVSVYTLNTIAAGILVLLLFDMKGIHHIGLQLSYAAVIGIHLFYKLLYKQIQIDNPIIAFLWSNCCISIAAQLTSFPLLILHFQTMAAWVLVSNFIMVPLSNFILYGLGILLLLPVSFPLTPYWAWMIEKYMIGFNNLVRNWGTASNVHTIHLQMSALAIGLYYTILLFVYLWLYFKQAKYLLAVLSAICLFLILKLFS